MPELRSNLLLKVSTGYRSELDGIRSICIIFTICNHLPDPPKFINGSIGVDIFFALSGWLITSLLLQEQSRTATIDIWSFYIRRIFRIVPLYALTVAAYGLAVLLIPAERPEFASAFWYLISFNREYLPEAYGNTFAMRGRLVLKRNSICYGHLPSRCVQGGCGGHWQQLGCSISFWRGGLTGAP